MNLHILAVMIGFCLDFMFGDPYWLWHPVRAMGALISWLERKVYKENLDETMQDKAGTLLWLTVIAVTICISFGILLVAYNIHPAVGLLVESIMIYQILAAKSLKTESMKVYKALNQGSVEDGRKAVSMIVGRDTKELSEEGIIRATVETVAENTSDGEVAPLFYLLIGGAGLGLIYKAINTMDSMIGYKNERYLHFGRMAATMDDWWNFIPARLAAFFMVAAAFLCGYDGTNAWKVYKRDRFNHKSPNSAHTEAACAGALRIQLAGGARYFGKYVEKPFIGDDLRSVETEDIKRANKLLYVTSCISLIAGIVVRMAIVKLIGR